MAERQQQRRRKIALACEPCRERKVRCDGGKPVCLACQRRGTPIAQCIYTIDNARTANRDLYIQTLHERIRALEETLERNTTGALPATEAHGVAVADSFRDTPGASTEMLIGNPCPPQPDLPQPSSQQRITEMISQDTAPSQQRLESHVERGVTAMGTLDHDVDVSESVTDSEQFYGSSSTASFMLQAAQTANNPAYLSNRSNAGGAPSRLSEREAKSSQGYIGHIFTENFSVPPRAFSDHLLDRFWERVYYLYPIFDRTAFECVYQNLWDGHEKQSSSGNSLNIGLGSAPDGGAHTPLFHCALNIIFAIGVSFSDVPLAAKEAAIQTFFARAKSFIGLDLLDINNIGLVQVMLLVTIFLQSTPFPSRCWNAIGIAHRVAQGLGLHTDKVCREGSPFEVDISRRTWQGCVILDMTVSMTFGRQAMTTHLPAYTNSRESTETLADISAHDGEHGASRMTFFAVSYQMCHLMNDILVKIYRGNNGSVLIESTSPEKYDDNFTDVLRLERKLLEYEDNLPPILSWERPMDLGAVSPSIKATIETQRLVLHRRFLYLRVMLFRPIFTKYSTDTGQHPVRTSIYNPFALQCAKNCVQSSMDLIQLVHQTHRNAATEWWWDALYACTSGLVLIFTYLRRELRGCFEHSTLDECWSYCETILEHLSENSVSVRRSLKLLKRIRDGIVPTTTEQPTASNLVTSTETHPDPEIRPLEHGFSELVDMLPFQLLNDAEVPNITDDWGQGLDIFSST